MHSSFVFLSLRPSGDFSLAARSTVNAASFSYSIDAILGWCTACWATSSGRSSTQIADQMDYRLSQSTFAGDASSSWMTGLGSTFL